MSLLEDYNTDPISPAIRVQREMQSQLDKVKARLDEFSKEVEQVKQAKEEAERERTKRDTFSHLASEETVYVRYGNFLGVPDPNEVEKLNRFLESLGLKNMSPHFNDSNLKLLFLLQQKFVAVNFKKGAFVASSDSYEHPVVEAEEFMHAKRGMQAAKKFGF
jgi:hypothetical protein